MFSRLNTVPFRVARRFETSRRREVVPFSFYQEVASLDLIRTKPIKILD
jgi:hypothetical protein